MLLMLTTLSEPPFDSKLEAAAATNTWYNSPWKTHNSQFVICHYSTSAVQFQGCDKLPEDRKQTEHKSSQLRWIRRSEHWIYWSSIVPAFSQGRGTKVDWFGAGLRPCFRVTYCNAVLRRPPSHSQPYPSYAPDPLTSTLCLSLGTTAFILIKARAALLKVYRERGRERENGLSGVGINWVISCDPPHARFKAHRRNAHSSRCFSLFFHRRTRPSVHLGCISGLQISSYPHHYKPLFTQLG